MLYPAGPEPRDIWVFGRRASLRFDPALDRPIAQNQISPSFRNFEGCSSVVDEQGTLQFYTNGETVDNRLGKIMPNGTALGGSTSASQGALAVRAVNNAKLYYLFTQGDKESNLQAGLRYSLIDMRLDNGLGP
ncbi:hypothetical protein [Hymenobacter cellulosilyticus]|uniref:Uncharacterized protein n=1 Tax=Hymenobacter cellulosilyticus TaxID=2932248 RepID=A0A8T9Q2M0_9BACT|nr:hypothetical protein [Hymenobacter cellulosilyticus]UOQ70088.1 hypothetical protein MUN79_15045 [Hymenobacter cellulosilyticus]